MGVGQWVVPCGWQCPAHKARKLNLRQKKAQKKKGKSEGNEENIAFDVV